jgi:hypothetical protein
MKKEQQSQACVQQQLPHGAEILLMLALPAGV